MGNAVNVTETPLERHDYTSTACKHAKHTECRKLCKFCLSPCQCTCHADMKTKIQLIRPLDDKFSIIVRDDHIEIIKTSNGQAIPRDEPIFLLRARDRLAIHLLRIYHELSIIDGCLGYHFTKLHNSIQKFQVFREENPNKMKQPSITQGL